MVEKESKEIYSFGIGCVFFSSFLAMFLGLGSYVMFDFSKNDTYIAVIIGAIISLGLFYIFNYIFKNNDTENLIELNKKIFGTITSSILNSVLFIAFFILACIILFNISNFLNIEYLPETSIDFFKILLILPIIYICSKDLSAIVKANQVFAIISIALIFVDLLGLYPKFNITNLEPIFNVDVSNFVHSILIYVILTIVSFCMVLITSKSKIKDKENATSTIFKMIIFSNIIQFIIILVTILVLGEDFISTFRFPEYITLKQFSLFNLLERAENILALHFYFNSFSLLTFLFYYMINILPGKKFKNYYSITISALIYVATGIVFKNGIAFYELVNSTITYVILGGILIPILITFFKMLKNDKKSKIKV